jgi:hypothetical protein
MLLKVGCACDVCSHGAGSVASKANPRFHHSQWEPLSHKIANCRLVQCTSQIDTMNKQLGYEYLDEHVRSTYAHRTLIDYAPPPHPSYTSSHTRAALSLLERGYTDIWQDWWPSKERYTPNLPYKYLSQTWHRCASSQPNISSSGSRTR